MLCIHNTIPKNCKAWIETGKEKFIECNTGRSRLNLNGAYDPLTNKVITMEGEKIDSLNTIELLKKIESSYADKNIIYAFADNAKYYKSKLVQEYLLKSKIVLIHIPPYCPNLNLIERLWKFMRKKVTNVKYFSKFAEFKTAILNFFDGKFFNWSKFHRREPLHNYLYEVLYDWMFLCREIFQFNSKQEVF
jgi:transposase